MTSILGLTLSELEEKLSHLPRFRAKQIYDWIIKGVSSFNDMKNIPLTLQNELKENFKIFCGSVHNLQEDNGTKKTVITLKDNALIESVLLNDGKKRFTACISTQAGCSCKCVFCKTGSIGFKRNLDTQEIMEQFLRLRILCTSDFNTNSKDSHIIDNIVFMGMGEPLLNLTNLRKTIEVLTCKNGFNFSKRRITVSTCGICDGLFDIADNGPYIRLALSLTTADEPLRQELMPIAVSNPLEKIKEALLLFQRNGGARITLEVPLLKDINTREKDALSIAKFASGIDCVVNVIPWNPVSGLMYKEKQIMEPPKKETEDYIRMLEKLKLKVTVRLHKGKKIMGACGQLGEVI